MADQRLGLAGVYASDPRVQRLVNDLTLSAGEAALRILVDLNIQTSERAVRRLRQKLQAQPGAARPDSVRTPAGTPELGSGRMELVGQSEGSFTDVTTDQPIVNDDWDHVFEKFNLNPANFRVVDDTVRMSTWQQSKRTESGDRDVVNLYSYSARFKRREDSALPDDVIEQWRESLRNNFFRYMTVRADGQGTYLILIADPQLGKKGTEEAKKNWIRGVEQHIDEIHRLMRAGCSPERIHVAWMGDETEGVANNYTNQPHTIELNQTQQLELDFDLRMWTLRELLNLGLPLSASSVISNHGEWTRNGSKDVVTTKNDNASTHIARQVKKAFESVEQYGVPHIEWTIGDDAPGVVINLSGVDCYFSHGYIEKGKGASTEIRTKNAIERQILGDTGRLASVPLYFMAHYHHYYAQEFEGRTLFGLPALEAERSSEYMLHQYGVWSPPGMLGLLIDRESARGWFNTNIF